MSEAPNFDKYTYKDLLDVYEHIDEDKYPERKLRVAELLEERKETDEAVAITECAGEHSKYSTFGLRFLAAILDGIFIFVVSFIISVILVIFPDPIAHVVSYVTTFEVFIYSVLLHGLYGQTVGKMIVAVKVVNHADEGNISFRQAFMRDCVPIIVLAVTIIVLSMAPADSDGNISSKVENLLYFLFAFHLTWFLIEVVTMLLNEKRRALHDFIAGTVVIRT